MGHAFLRQRRLACLVPAVLCLLCVGFLAPAAAQPVPLPRAHAHNDYEHPRPLLDALDHGFCSVEADVHLVAGELLVAHDRRDARPGRTLQALYLDPLRARIQHNAGRVYPDGPPFILLIDIKSNAEATYEALRRLLGQYADILTVFNAGTVDEGPVTAIVSGNRPRAMMQAEAVRYAAFDGRLDDLDADPPASASFMPLVSSHWAAVARWRGRGALSEKARRRLQEAVEKAHAQGRKIRFWATPDDPAVWRVLFDAGVDLLNADDLARLQAFLLEHEER